MLRWLNYFNWKNMQLCKGKFKIQNYYQSE